MASGYGMLGFVGVGRETTWGTPVAAASYFEAMSEGLAATLDRFETRNIIAGLYEPDDTTGVLRVAGPVATALYPQNGLYLLNGAMGISSVTVVLSGLLFKNELYMAASDTSSNNPLPSYTYEVFRDVTSSQQYAGMLVNRLRLSAAPNGPLMAEAELVGKNMVHIAKTTPTFVGSSAQPFMFDTASLQIAGAAVAHVEQFEISIDNQLEGVPTLNNSTTIARIRRTGPQMIGFGGTLSFEDITDFDRFLNQTEFAFKASFIKAASFSAILDLPRVVYTAFPTGVNGRGRQTVAVQGKARYLATSASAFMATVTNQYSAGAF